MCLTLFFLAIVSLQSGLFRSTEPTTVVIADTGPKPSYIQKLLPGPSLGRREIAEALGKRRFTAEMLTANFLTVDHGSKKYNVYLTMNSKMQERVEAVYKRTAPAYAAFVAMDPDTGRILAMVDYSSAEDLQENLALQATFPAASVFKVVTSAAALSEGKIQPKAVFPVNGSFGTLYKRNLRNSITPWTRFISVEDAFAKSVNTVFGKIARDRLGSPALQKFADLFGFNQHVDFDMPLDMGSAIIPDDSFGLAESGSGYTRRQTLNPVQGAMIASAIIDAGSMPSPFLVQEVFSTQGLKLYEHEPRKFGQPTDPETARTLGQIMEQTIIHGTARKEFRDYNHHPILSKLFIGAKTGSLSGEAPAGRYDWFVGFAQSTTNPKKKIAFASMIINRKVWKIKAAQVAREAILEYFNNGGVDL